MALATVLFDLDGTLADSAPAIAAALSQVRAERGAGPIGAAAVRPWISLGAPELVRRGLAEAGGDPERDLAVFRERLRALPTPAGSLYPGVRPMLRALGRAGLALGVVTNKPEALAVKLLQDLAVASRFGAVVGGDSTSHAKPHPAPVRAALAVLGATRSEAAFVGDSAVDADAAEAVGLPFHLFEGGYGARECDGRRLASRFADHAALAATLLASARAAA